MKNPDIEIHLGEEFQPFKGMNKLLPGDTPDVFGISRTFSLKDYGKGAVRIVGEGDFAKQKYYLIVSSKNEAQAVWLPHPLGNFYINIDPSSLLRNQPPLWCTVKVDRLNFVSPNLAFLDELPLSEGIFFYDFGPRNSSRRSDLVVPSSIAFLRNIKLRFDLRYPQNPSGYS